MNVQDAILRFRSSPGPVLLTGAVQHYDWGEVGDDALIPELLGQAAVPEKPYAELWFGAHPAKPSTATWEKTALPLDALIAAAPTEILGPAAARLGGELPFLLKILAIAKPLSLQAHPNEAQARAGFEREEKAGTPRDAAERCYRDPRAKPELIVALTDVYALCGFRKDLPDPEKDFRAIMALPQEEVDRRVGARLDAMGMEDFPKTDVRHWVLSAYGHFGQKTNKDRGLLVMELLNVVHLRPGEGLFLPANRLHCYLEGAGIEVMGNSDNVLRGGLTTKHVNAEELARLLVFKSDGPVVLHPDAAGRYRAPAKEFALALQFLEDGEAKAWDLRGPELLLLLDGAANVTAGSGSLPLERGAAALLPAAAGKTSLRSEGGAWLARVFVPLDEPSRNA